MLDLLLSATFAEILSLDYVKIILFVVLALILGVCLYVSKLSNDKRLRAADEEARAKANSAKEEPAIEPSVETEAKAQEETPCEVKAVEATEDATVEEPAVVETTEDATAEEPAEAETAEEPIAEEPAETVEVAEEPIVEEQAAPAEDADNVIVTEPQVLEPAPLYDDATESVVEEKSEEPEEIAIVSDDAQAEETSEEIVEETESDANAVPAEADETAATQESAEDAPSDEGANDEPKVKGKFVATQSPSTAGKYVFFLKANNGAILYESRVYSSKKTCKDGIESFKRAVSEGEFRVDEDQSGRFSYVLQSGSMTYHGETVSAKATSENTIVAVKKFAPSATYEDLMDASVSEISWLGNNTSMPYVPTTKCSEEIAEGGKYVISKTEGKKCVFELKANNGHSIYLSREYSSKAACKNGIESFKNAVEFGKFRIDQDRSGRYSYTIQYGSVTIQGETVLEKKTSEGTIESVRRFVLTTKVIDKTIE